MHLSVAGWTGRDPAKVQQHIDELAELGIKPPSTVPLFYRVSSALLTHSDRIDVVGAHSSGEVEPLLVVVDNMIYLGLGSDHTDRALEAHSIALSKQICAKPVSGELWPFDSVNDHLDALEMTSWIYEEGGWVIYQQGNLSAIRPLEELIAASGIRDLELKAGEAAAMLCGTLGITSGGVRSASAFRMELYDPKFNRKIDHIYEIITLPNIS